MLCASGTSEWAVMALYTGTHGNDRFRKVRSRSIEKLTICSVHVSLFIKNPLIRGDFRSSASLVLIMNFVYKAYVWIKLRNVISRQIYKCIYKYLNTVQTLADRVTQRLVETGLSISTTMCETARDFDKHPVGQGTRQKPAERPRECERDIRRSSAVDAVSRFRFWKLHCWWDATLRKVHYRRWWVLSSFCKGVLDLLKTLYMHIPVWTSVDCTVAMRDFHFKIVVLFSPKDTSKEFIVAVVSATVSFAPHNVTWILNWRSFTSVVVKLFSLPF